MRPSATYHQREIVHRVFIGGSSTFSPGSSVVGKTGARAVAMITRRYVKPGCSQHFNNALRAFAAFSLSFPGHLDVHVLLRTTGDSEECVIANRFVNSGARMSFTSSWEYRSWLRQLRTLTEVVPNDEPRANPAGSWIVPNESPRQSVRLQGIAGVILFFGLYLFTLSLPVAAYIFRSSWRAAVWNFFSAALVLTVLVSVGVLASQRQSCVSPSRFARLEMT